MSQLGRIGGPVLSANLLRDGSDLAFETDLLYLSVADLSNPSKIVGLGINNDSPNQKLTVTGTSNFNNGAASIADLIVTTQADLADLTFLTYKIQNPTGAIYITPDQTTDPTIVTNELRTSKLKLSDTAISTLLADDNIEITANGIGEVKFTTTKLDITGNLHATGDITFDGDIIFGDSDTDTVTFNADIHSDLIPDSIHTYDLGSTTKQWNTLYSDTINTDTITTPNLTIDGINMLLEQGNRIYVSQNGSDTNIGTHMHGTYRTVKKALSQAVSGDEIIIFPGEYEEEFPLTVPVGVSINGAGIRSVSIFPTTATNDKDAFLMNGESTIAHLTVKNVKYNSINNTGYAFRFANGMKVTTRSPYIQNVSVINTVPNAGPGALADGSIVDAASKEATLLFHSVTFIVPDADGITATNGTRVEWLNSFTYFANRGIYLTRGTAGFAGLGLKFGAEMRSIGSANVYGNYGAVADGADTLGYLIGHNFGYVGTGTDSNNDYGLTVQANEIVELNDGVLYYDSMDHKGDYRVGDIFYVNQETGQISFNAQSINFTATGNITLEGPAGQIIVDAYKVQASNIRIYDNNIDSLIGPVELLAQSGTTTLNTDVNITGNLDVTGDLTVGGNVYLGDNPLDTVNVIPRLTQTINPDDVGGPFSLGAGGLTPKVWRTAFLNSLNVDGITQIQSNTLTTLTTDTDLRLEAAGSGNIQVSTTNVEITNNLTVTTATSLKNTVIGIAALTTQVNQNLSGTSSPTGFFFYGWQILNPGQTVPTFSVIQPGWTVVGHPDWVVTVVGDGVTNYDITITGGSFASGGTYSFTGPLLADITHVGDYDQTGDTDRTGDTDITGHLTVVGAHTVQLEDVQIISNKITTTVGNNDLTFEANGTGTVKILTNNVQVNNNLNVIGTGYLDTVEVTTTLQADEFTTGNISIVDNYITTTALNWDLELLAHGIGKISVPLKNVEITNNLTVDNTTTINGTSSLQFVEITGLTTLVGNIGQTGSVDIIGNVTSVNDIIGHDYLQASKIRITNNVFNATDPDADIQFTANGTGGVVLDSRLKITNNAISNVWASATTDAQRSIKLSPDGTGKTVVDSTKSIRVPVGNNTNKTLTSLGEIRLNSTTLLYEGKDANGVIALKGVWDVDKNTYITAELTPGANDNTLRFVTNNTVKATINSTRLFTDTVHIDNIRLNGNTVNNRTTGNDLTFVQNNNGLINVNNMPLGPNTIINPTNTALVLTSTGIGYVKFSGTFGVVIPTGTTLDRPASGTEEVGEIRHNTSLDYMEVWNGTAWIPAVGTLGAAPLSEVLDIMDFWSLILG